MWRSPRALPSAQCPNRYLETVTRTRKFGKYLLRDLASEPPMRLEYKGNHFIQTGDYNELVRQGKMALVRKYEEHDDGFFENPLVQAVLGFAARTFLSLGAKPGVPFELGLHTVRLTAPGMVTPEGVHCDGYDFVLSTVIDREGIEGGASLFYASKDQPPILEVPMEAGDAVVINDKALFHAVEGIRPAPGHAKGHRDVILLTGRPWPTDAQGNLIDDVALHLSQLEGSREAPEQAAPSEERNAEGAARAREDAAASTWSRRLRDMWAGTGDRAAAMDHFFV